MEGGPRRVRGPNARRRGGEGPFEPPEASGRRRGRPVDVTKGAEVRPLEKGRGRGAAGKRRDVELDGDDGRPAFAASLGRGRYAWGFVFT